MTFPFTCTLLISNGPSYLSPSVVYSCFFFNLFCSGWQSYELLFVFTLRRFSSTVTVLPWNKVHAMFQEISVPYAVVYLMLWYTFANPFRGPQYPQNCKNGPKKPQSSRKCTFYNIIRYFIGHHSLYYR